MQNKVSSIRRNIYLNIYAYLLVLLGIGIAFLPVYSLWKPLVILQVIASAVPINAGMKIFRRWKEKKRIYRILIRRNRNGIRTDSFKEHMQAPCGRQLVKVVLKDLGESDRYREIRKQSVPSLGKRIKTAADSCKHRKTRVYFHERNNDA
jgi:hypothetical protein